jgi:hypothetical protein
MESSHRKKIAIKQQVGHNQVKEATLQLILVSKRKLNYSDYEKSLLLLLRNFFIMKVGVNFINENLNQLVNNNQSPSMPNA